MTKTIQTQPQYFLTFTDEEVASLGLQSGDEFECQPLETGGFLLKKKNKLDIELSEYPREILEYLIQESINKNVTIATIITDALENYLNIFDGNRCDPEDD